LILSEKDREKAEVLITRGVFDSFSLEVFVE